MVRIWLIGVIIALNLAALGQNTLTTKSRKATEYYNNALSLFNEYRFNEAISQLTLAIEADANFLEAYLVRAETYGVTENYTAQIADLLVVAQKDEKFYKYLYYNLAEAYYLSGDYAQAVENVDKFRLQTNVQPHSLANADILKTKCGVAAQLVKNPVPFNPVMLSTAINTANDQYWPSLSIDENTLVYTVLLPDSTRAALYGDWAKQEDFFISHRENGQWQTGTKLSGSVNTNGNEGAQTISADGKTLVFTACGRKDGLGRCDLYISKLQNNQWTKPLNMGPPVNSLYSEKQPTLSADGNALYFMSDRPGGLGNLDIWCSYLTSNGKWSAPQNLGAPINTPEDEASPFLHPDNQTLYFSSDGHPGLGKKDIFLTRRQPDGTWSQPQNLGYPINTHRDEIGLIVNAQATTAYFSTNYNSTSRNIVQFEMPQATRPNAVSYVKGRIYDAVTLNPVTASFWLQNLQTADTVTRSVSDSLTGAYLVCLPAGFNYALSVQHPNYLFYTLNFNLTQTNTAQNPLTINIGLQKIQVGEKVVLNNVFFETDSYELKPESTTEINNLVRFIQQNPNLRFEVGGHTDNTGNSQYNQSLSEKRAKAVFDQLVASGITASQLSFKGYGDSQPVVENNSEQNKALNRRTELKITEVNP